jgi:hypothetical protein
VIYQQFGELVPNSFSKSSQIYNRKIKIPSFFVGKNEKNIVTKIKLLLVFLFSFFFFCFSNPKNNIIIKNRIKVKNSMLIIGLAFTVRAVLKAGSRAVTRITLQKLPMTKGGGGGNSK